MKKMTYTIPTYIHSCIDRYTYTCIDGWIDMEMIDNRSIDTDDR